MQTDAKGVVTTMTYDALGRMLTRTDDATGTPQTATWEYDTATKGIGKLTRTYNTGYQAVSAYDSLGRPSSVTETIDGTIRTNPTKILGCVFWQIRNESWPGRQSKTTRKIWARRSNS